MFFTHFHMTDHPFAENPKTEALLCDQRFEKALDRLRFFQQSGNLARCFRGEENFNPIDMVMRVKRLNFREAVEYLKELVIMSNSDFNKWDLTHNVCPIGTI